MDSSKPLGPQVVSALHSIVENPACHRVYFDNFFEKKKKKVGFTLFFPRFAGTVMLI